MDHETKQLHYSSSYYYMGHFSKFVRPGAVRIANSIYTDKPVIVLVTHGHVDHAMGAAEFENVYMSHEDDYIYEKHGTDAFRRSCFSTVTPPFEAGEEDLIPTMKLSEIKNLTEGDRLSC